MDRPDDDQSAENANEPAGTSSPDRLDASSEEPDQELRESIHLLATVAKREEWWLGPLPPDETMAGYQRVSPTIPEAIMADFDRRSIATVDAAAQQFQIANRKLDIEEREQKARLEADKADIAFRNRSAVVLWGMGIALILILAIAAILFSRDPSGAGALGLLSLIIGVCVAFLVIGGKGRLSQVESETQVKSISGVANAIGAVSGTLTPEDTAHAPEKSETPDRPNRQANELTPPPDR